MKTFFFSLALIISCALAFPSNARALNMTQFMEICKSSNKPCNEHPLLQAYVGGALDIVAMLSEETSYLEKIYCEDTSTLFDVPRIIDYMEQYEKDYASKNAMLLLIRYLDQHGGC